MNRVLCLGAVACALISCAFLRSHSEDSLLQEWSVPPPWPVFVGLNVLAASLRKAADALTPPPIRVLEKSFGFHQTAYLYVLSKYGIPDFLASGPKSVAQIADHMLERESGTAASVDSARVERFLYAAAAWDLLTLLPSSGALPVFGNSALSAVLRADHPNSMAGFVGSNAEDVAPSMLYFTSAFFRRQEEKEQGSASKSKASVPWDLAFPDFPSVNGGLWSFFSSHPAREEQFGRAMTGVDSFGGAAAAIDGPFAQFSTLIDVGGSRGHMLYRLLELHASATGILFDRPPVIETIAREALSMQPESIQKRVRIEAGSFFEAKEVPVVAHSSTNQKTAYMLRYILHDYGDADALQILKNVRAAIGDDAGRKASTVLLIGESAIPDRDAVSPMAMAHSIDMQMMTMFGDAWERTPKSWASLLEKSGFKLQQIHPTRSLLHWVEAVPM